MSGAKPRTKTKKAAVSQLSWSSSLQFKLGLIFVVLVVLLGAGALVAGKFLVSDKLVTETYRYETESGLRLQQELHGITQQTEDLASMLTKLTFNLPGGITTLQPLLPQLVERVSARSFIVSVGVWPEPRTLDPTRERASILWARGAGDAMKLREDYNDPRTIPYHREKWYTPARYSQDNRCYWSPVYNDPITKRDVITCSMPIRQSDRYVGAVTVSLGLENLRNSFAASTAEELGYSLLVDQENQLLAASQRMMQALGATLPRNTAELAQKYASFNTVALSLHKQSEERVSAVARSPLYNAGDISALRDGSRNMSRAEAETALSQIWGTLGKIDGSAARNRIEITADPVLADDAFALIFPLAGTHWQLIRVTPVKEGFTGARYVFQQSLLVTGGALVLTLILVFSGLRYMVISPLRKMTRQITQAETAEDALHLQLDESARNEIGVMAHWHNERVRQLREMMERTIATNSQLVMESEERRKAQEQLARIQERASLALQSVADGVITTDEHGNIEDMNPVAETLTGVPLRTGRGKNFAEVFVARMGGDNGAPLPNLAEIAVQRGTRLDYPEGIQLSSFGGSQRNIGLIVTPIRARHSKVIGAVIVFREQKNTAVEIPSTASAALADRKALDALTGLATRTVCDKRIRSLIDAAKLTPRKHCLLILDIDHLKRVNDNGGQNAGDEALAKVAETLSGKVGTAGQVFRMTTDQFAVLLENFDADRGRIFAEALRESIANTRFYWESKYFSITASFGVTTFDGTEENQVDTIRRADDACAAAKRAGRNCVRVYDESMNRAGNEADDSTWVRRIRAGLDDNMFHLTTQYMLPTPNLASEGNNFEILLALEDEEGFWAAPSAFMQTAERHHLSGEMDRWVISRILAQLTRNPAVLEKLSMVSINLSAGSLMDGGLLEFLITELEKNPDVHPRKLCFELNENDIAEYPQAVHTLTDALRSAGCRVAVDHFMGRDPGQLAQLRKLSIDFLKIDAKRFRNIVNDSVEQMLAESVVRLGRTLRKRVIVSNIDDTAALDAWKRLGVDYFQGFLVAKPSPVIFQTPNGS